MDYTPGAIKFVKGNEEACYQATCGTTKLIIVAANGGFEEKWVPTGDAGLPRLFSTNKSAMRAAIKRSKELQATVGTSGWTVAPTE